MPLKVLRILAVVEVVTLTIMLTNLALIHIDRIGSTLGPVHGLAYLSIVICTLLVEGAPLRTRLLSLVPAVGGFLVLRRLQPAAVPEAE